AVAASITSAAGRRLDCPGSRGLPHSYRRSLPDDSPGSLRLLLPSAGALREPDPARRRASAPSLQHPVMHMRDTLLAFEDPRPLEADLLRPEALEQTTPLTEKHGDDMELDLVKDAGAERELCDSCAVH